MQGRNPYSPYLPANNPSIFARQKDDNLSKYLGMGGTVVGGIAGGVMGAGGGPLGIALGAMKGASLGGAAGSGLEAVVSDDGNKAQGSHSIMGAGTGIAKWYEEEEAKKGAAAMLNAIGGA